MPRAGSQLPVESVRAAEFAFFGTVRRLGASNVAQVAASSDLALVRVGEVVVAPASLGAIRGRDLTVRLSRGARVGAEALFLASSWLVSDQIAVIELARLTGQLDRAGPRELVLAEKLRAFDDELLARIAVADLVVRGLVIQVSTIEIPPSRREDEDIAAWRLAAVEVLDVLKGRPSPTVRVAFLDPRPPRWYDAPLFTEGQEGLWLLRMVEHTREWRELETVPKGAYSALHPLDAQAPSLFGRVHALTQLSTSKQRRKR